MKKHDFTLIELLIVIGIILVLVGITIGGLNRAAARGDEAKTIALMKKMELALDAFYADYGYYPVQETAGDVNFSNSQWNLFINTTNKRHKSYLEGYGTEDTFFDDAYGNHFQYQYPDNTNATTKFRLWSTGKNSAPADSEDDICSWKKH